MESSLFSAVRPRTSFCLISLLACALLLAAPRLARAAGEVAVTPYSAQAGQTVTMRWYFTGRRVLLSGGRFGKGVVVTGRSTAVDRPARTTQYTFDVWYANPKAHTSSAPLIHVQYAATAHIAPAIAHEAPALSEEQIAQRILDLTNRFRADNGLPPLMLTERLSSAARWMARDMADNDYMEHTDHDGRDFEARIAALGYTSFAAIGENIARGQRTADEVVAAWKASPGHRANMLSPEFREIGVGHAAVSGGPYRHYWVQDFGARPAVN